jgi:2-phospho-L-lactate/phosphoenolpyruvate guanylyltransferase
MIDKRVFAIVPVKPLKDGKSRLAPILDCEERKGLNAFLMQHTFDLLAAFPGPSRSIVISADAAVAAEVEARGMSFVLDEDCELNAALAKATRAAGEKGAEAVIVLPVDLPLATSADLKRIASLAGPSRRCILVSDRHRSGTNLLYVSPPCADIYRFGPGSFALHAAAAAALGFQTVEIHDSALSLDIDEPADYERWRSSPAALAKRGKTHVG